jgi:hypothetical protein
MKISARKLSVSLLIICLAVTSLSFASTASAYYPLSQCSLSTSVNYSGAGWVSPGGQNMLYYYGQSVTVYAYTYTGYVFDGWYLNGVYQGKLSTITLTMWENYELYAVFSQRTAILTITSDPSDAGSTTPGSGIWNYSAGASAQIKAYPATGNAFSGWYLDGIYQGAGTTITVTMNSDHQLSAFFSGNGSNPTPAPTATPSPAPTANPDLPKPALSFYCTSSTTTTGFNVKIQGALAYNQIGLSGAGIVFSYSATGGATWHDLAYIITGDDGTFSAVWMPSASGNYIVRGTWATDYVYQGVTSEVSFAVTPNTDSKMFSVTSNSTLSALAFDSTTGRLSFTVSGASGTVGFVQACIPKTLLPDTSTLKVSLDGTDITFDALSQGDVWIITLGYHHSTHSIVMTVGSSPTPTPTNPPTTNPTSNPTNNPTQTSTHTTSPSSTPTVPELTPLVVLPLTVVLLGLAIFAVLKRRTKTVSPQ